MFPQLSTNRLLLLQILPSDQPFIFEGLSHPEVIPFYGVRYETLEAASAQMDWYNQILREGTGIPWKIVEKKSQEKIGVVCVYHYKPEHKKAEIGFWLLPAYWNRGYATEALRAAIGYWRKEKQLHRLEAFVEEGNTASSRLLERSGFRYEGRMKDCEIKNGRFISLLIYGLVGEEEEVKMITEDPGP